MTAATPKRLTRGARVIKFIEEHCVFSAGRWVGEPFKLLPWQKRYILNLFEVDPETKKRRYRWSLLGIPKKNGKSELCAALALYFLIADGEKSPLVCVAAASEEQADLVFGAASTMAELSPTLNPITERYDREILLKGVTGAKIQRVAAAAGTNDGKNIHVVILDELHEWTTKKHESVWTVLTNGTGAREQPMVLQITTAGYDLETVCGRQYEYGKKIENGEIQDDRFYFKWFEAPADSDHKDPDVWEAANPSYGHIMSEDFYDDQVTKKTESEFRRYFLNQWVEAEDLWLPTGTWESLRNDEFEFDPELPMWVAVDAATKYDSTAIVWGQWFQHPDKDDPVFGLRSRIWERPTHPATGKPVEGWVLPFAEIENHIRELHTEYSVETVGYDPAFFTSSAQRLAAEGIELEEVPQTNPRMVPASQTLYELITTERLVHSGDPALARHVRNVHAKPVSGGGERLEKKRGKKHRKVDGAIAAAMCVWLAFQDIEEQEEEETSNFWFFDDESGKAESAW